MLRLICFSALWTLGSGCVLAASEPLEIGHAPQFFLDDFMVDNRWSLKPKHEEVLRVFHQPKKHERNPVISGDGGYVSVARDAKSGTFKMWYQTHQWRNPGEPGSDYAIAYAESTDGLTWKLPQLGLFEWKGTKANNIVWLGKGGKRASGQQVFEAPAKDCRGYQFLMEYHTAGVRGVTGGLRVVGSQDGIHWDEASDSLLVPLSSDTVNSIVYDETADEYVMFCRAKDRYMVGGEKDFLNQGESRRISRISGKGIWQTWTTAPVSILIPDELDMERGFNRFYGLSAKRHAGITWGFVWPFKLNTDIVTELTWSRDNWHWQRFPTRPRLIELGPEGAWDDGMVFGSADWLEIGNEWWLYYAGHDGPHESRERKAGIGLATVRKEGFISLHGPPGGGVMCTKLLRWPGGSLFLNADAAHGQLRARVMDEKRKMLAGFDYGDGETFAGDSTAHEVKWGQRTMDEFKDRVLRLEIFLRDADLYTFRAAAQ